MRIKRFNEFLAENTQVKVSIKALSNKNDKTKNVVSSIYSDSKKIANEMIEYIESIVNKLIDKDIFTKDNYNKTFEDMGNDHADTRAKRREAGVQKDPVIGDSRPEVYIYDASHGLGNFFKLMRYDLLNWLKEKKYLIIPVMALEFNVYTLKFEEQLSGKNVFNDTKYFSQILRDKIKKWLTLSGEKISITENLKNDLLDLFNLDSDGEKFLVTTESGFNALKENYQNLNKKEDPKEESILKGLKTKAQGFFKSLGILEEE